MPGHSTKQIYIFSQASRLPQQDNKSRGINTCRPHNLGISAGFRLAEVTGGGGRGEPASFTLPAKVGMLDNGNEAITIDFSPKGGPKDFTGVFEINSDGTKGIRFLRDRNFWPMQ